MWRGDLVDSRISVSDANTESIWRRDASAEMKNRFKSLGRDVVVTRRSTFSLFFSKTEFNMIHNDVIIVKMLIYNFRGVLKTHILHYHIYALSEYDSISKSHVCYMDGNNRSVSFPAVYKRR